MLQQIEILLEGFNPHAGDALSEAEVRRLKPVLGAAETLRALVRGRVAGAGAALWLLTNQRLLVLDPGCRSIEFEHLQAVAAEPGRYGVALTIHSSGRRHALFGADRGLATSFAAALAAAAPAARHGSTLRALTADEALAASEQLAEARARLQPSSGRWVGQTVVLLQEAAALRDRGVLNEAEFSLLKGRLLAAA